VRETHSHVLPSLRARSTSRAQCRGASAEVLYCRAKGSKKLVNLEAEEIVI
jgi:hypothetical protein